VASAQGDADVEPDEGFTVTLSNPVNAVLGTATATGVIQNDDAAPANNTIFLLPLENDFTDLMGHTVTDIYGNIEFTGPTIFGTPSANFIGVSNSPDPPTLLRMAHAPDLNISQYSELTFEGFINADSNAAMVTHQAILASESGDNYSGLEMFSLYTNGFEPGTIEAEFAADSGNWDWGYETGNVNFPDNTSFHFAYVLQNGIWKYYVNGVLAHSFDAGDIQTNYGKQVLPLRDGLPLNFGGQKLSDNTSSGYQFLGGMKSLRLTRIAVYTAPFTPPSAPLGII
jgi:hypothetical protein